MRLRATSEEALSIVVASRRDIGFLPVSGVQPPHLWRNGILPSDAK